MDEFIYKYSPYVWWPITALFILSGLGSIGDFLEALPGIISFILPLLYTGLSIVMFLRYNDKKDKSMNFHYIPSEKVKPVINKILNQQILGDGRDRDEYLSNYIDELILKD